MSLFDIFKREHIVVPRPVVFDKAVAANRLRLGMWVRVAGRTGILTAVDSAGYADVQLVNSDGTNAMRLAKREDGTTHLINDSVIVKADAVTQATYKEIPEPRRPAKVHATDRGYM